MSRILTTVWIFGILMWTRLCSVCQAQDVKLDPECYDTCNCCKNNTCTTRYGWDNVCTKGCIDGHRGARCYQLCTYNCSSCPESANKCETCYDGFYLGQDKACKECPATCTTCTSQTKCTACKDGYYDKDGSSTCAHSVCSGNCKCSNNVCVDCKNGFFDTTTSCSKECPSNCVTCSSINLCNECEDGYYNGHEFEDYIKPEFNNCTFTCRDSCTKCESYDNCSQCVTGKYGQKCQYNCSIGCKDGTCNVESGTCTCSSNFIGHQCNECAYGKYGTYCNNSCSVYCKDRACDSLGHCRDGCITYMITGETCNSCVPGMYGELCTETCPPNCKNKTCERYTRACSYDCEGNFDGEFCEICKHGKHGETCNLDCPVNCENSICEKENGRCLTCAGNFDGDKCYVCKPGFYGPNCNHKCFVHCFNETCSIDSGVCDYGCTNGYSGDKCCVHSDNCIGCASNTECNKCKSGYFGTLCDDSCPTNCLDSCDFTTGVCVDCKIKYFGLTCNNTCSSLCIDNVCTQEKGICVKGCTYSYEDPECAIMSDEPTEVSDQNSSETIIAVLATISAVSTTALCVLIAVIILKKIRSRDRQAKGSSLQIHFDNSLVGRQNSQNEGGTVVSKQDNVAYETLEVNQDGKAYDLKAKENEQEVYELYSNQEETDSRIILYMKYGARKGFNMVIVRTPDTDIFFICLHHAGSIQATIYGDIGTGKQRKILNVSELADTYGHEYCTTLLGFHVFTGEDVTSAFKGKGKVLPLRKLQSNPKYHEAFRMLGNTWLVEERMLKLLETFVCLMYGYGRENEVNKVRFYMLKKMIGVDEDLTVNSKVELHRLPLCFDNLTEHKKRVNYRVAVLKHANEAIIECPKPYEAGQGWAKSEDSNYVEPVWASGPVLPSSMVELVENAMDAIDEDNTDDELNDFEELTLPDDEDY